MSYERMLNGDAKPTGDDNAELIGERISLWKDVQRYLEERYDFTPEMVFYGKKYGWAIRYRKSGKTLCSLFPEKGAFTVLIVLGTKEVEKTISMIDELSPEVRTLFENTEQLRDGRWFWMRVTKRIDIESIKLLLGAKRKPKKSLIED